MDARHRTRFRRDIPTRNRRRNGLAQDDMHVSGILSDLGSRLGTFKVDFSLHRNFPLIKHKLRIIVKLYLNVFLP